MAIGGVSYSAIHSSACAVKGDQRQEHGMHFDGIVAGLEGQRQWKIAKKKRKSTFPSQTAESVQNPPVIRF
jgi:hypothetical protein